MSADIPVIDTHQHMWYLSKWALDWVKGSPSLNKDFTMEDYVKAVEGCNVVQTVFVETDAIDKVAEAETVLAMCADPSIPVSGAVLGGDLASSEFRAYVEKYAKNKYVKGIRQVFHVQPQGFCLKEEVIANIKLMGDLGLSCDICIQPDQLKDIVSLAKEIPNTIFILDHCGGHQGLKKNNREQRAAWEQGIMELANLSNVISKISGLYGGWDGGMDDWKLELQASTMDFVMDKFPEDRVVFGGDWPVCEDSGPISTYIKGTKEMVLKKRGVDYAKKLFSENAKRWYKLKNAPQKKKILSAGMDLELSSINVKLDGTASLKLIFPNIPAAKPLHKPMPNPSWQQTMLRVKNPEKSLAFYIDIMGMTLIDKLDFPSLEFSLYFLTTLPIGEKYPYTPGTLEANAYLWSMKCVTLELTHNYGTEKDNSKYHTGNKERDGFGHIAFACDDVYKSCEMLEKKKISFQKKPDEGRMKGLAFALDPDGYWVEIVSRVKEDCSHLPEFSLAQTMIRVKDPVKSLAFYTQVCGMALLSERHFKTFSLYFLGTIADGNTSDISNARKFYSKGPVLELTHNHGTEDKEDFIHFNGNEKDRKGFGHIGFLVDDVYEACVALESNGMEFKKKPDEGNIKGLAFALDPDGYWIEIIPRGMVLKKEENGVFQFTPRVMVTAKTDLTEDGSQKDAILDGEDKAKDAVFVKSEDLPSGTPVVKGYDFNNGIDFDALFQTYKTIGFQATNLGLAIDQINQMLEWRLSDEPPETSDDDDDMAFAKEDPSKVKCTIFFGYTSNMISCGMREIIRFLCEHRLVDYIVTTGGGIEEDFMKCFRPHYIGDFKLRGRDLRLKGQNRIGNLIVPNKNYCSFEDFMNPILDAMLLEQKNQGVCWTPSKIIDRLGKEIDNPESVYYWCHKNKIPVLCPAITDGSIGDMIFFHGYNNPGLVVDLVGDLRIINEAALQAKKTGMLILGGGIVKHHICNANLMRNGADFSVFINTGQEFDGSDSGAKPEEAISWGKISLDAKPVKVYGDASLIFPIVASQSFVKYHFKQQQKSQKHNQQKHDQQKQDQQKQDQQKQDQQKLDQQKLDQLKQDQLKQDQLKQNQQGQHQQGQNQQGQDQQKQDQSRAEDIPNQSSMQKKQKRQQRRQKK